MKYSSTHVGFRIAAAALIMISEARGHIMHTKPVSRQYSRTRDFLERGHPDLETLPYAWNAGAGYRITPRAIAKTDPDILAANGEGIYFPLPFAPLASNGNYEESNEIAKRHGVCGDPRKNRAENANEDVVYSTPNSNWPVIDSYTSGEVMEVHVAMEYYHAGHLEFRICDIGDLEDPDGVATQECFNTYQLDRAADDGSASPIDPNHRGRYYVDPPCRKDELEQPEPTEMHHTHESYFFKARYVLPDIECEHCVLQMHYLTGHRCRHVGYDEFNPPSWPSQCAPNKEDWIGTPGTICGTAVHYPEEFWQCSDISISRGKVGATSEPTPAPTAKETANTTTNGTPEPTTRSTPAPDFVCAGDAGILKSGICCEASCGTCGGIGCNDNGNGGDSCCTAKIREAGKLCSTTGEAPCIANDLSSDGPTQENCSGTPVEPYEECDGDGSDGSTTSTCCTAGHKCTAMCDDYSQAGRKRQRAYGAPCLCLRDSVARCKAAVGSPSPVEWLAYECLLQGLEYFRWW